MRYDGSGHTGSRGLTLRIHTGGSHVHPQALLTHEDATVGVADSLVEVVGAAELTACNAGSTYTHQAQ